MNDSMKKSPQYPFPTYNDLVFHGVLGSERSEPQLTDLVNAVLQNEHEPLLKKLEIRNPFNLKDYFDEKETVLDVRAQDESSRWLNIEVQTAETLFFQERMLYYWSRLYTSQIDKGKHYSKLLPTLSIAFVKFPIYNDRPDILFDSYFAASKHYERRTLSDHFRLYFVQIPDHFDENVIQTLNPKLVNWIKFLKFPDGISEEEMDNIATQDPQIAESLEKRNDFLADRKVRDYIEARERDRRDEVARLQLAHIKGIEKGIEEGIEKGIKEGIEKGIKKGEIRGKVEAIIDFLQEDFGEISPYLESRIRSISTSEQAVQALKIVRRTTSLEDFEHNLNNILKKT